MMRAMRCVPWLVVLVLAGCAPVVNTPPGSAAVPQSPPPKASTAVATTPPKASAAVAATPVPAPMRGAPAIVDSLPSDAARAVLASIPEPLKPAERIPPPVVGVGVLPDLAAAIDAAADTIPVPSPTRALGDDPSALSNTALPDSLLRVQPPLGAAGAAVAGAAAAGAAAGAVPPSAGTPPAAAASDTCWRIQFAAPTERDQADAKRAAAESQLSVPVVVEPESGRFKVRTRDCLTREAADALRNRATLSGFDGAFRVAGKSK